MFILGTLRLFLYSVLFDILKYHVLHNFLKSICLQLYTSFQVNSQLVVIILENYILCRKKLESRKRMTL